MATYLSRDNLFRFLDALTSGYAVYVPVKKNEQRFYKKYLSPSEDIIIGEVRTFEPLKAFFHRARGIVAHNFSDDIPHSDDKPFAIVGVKACDLKGFKIQDHVFKDDDYPDPFYIKNREQNLIISADCTCAIDTCFCLVGSKPYPQEDFDINLSQVEKGFVVEVGSEKGQEIIDKNPSLFELASESMISEKDRKREAVISEVEKNIAENNVPKEEQLEGAVERNFESDIWGDEAQTCVECGACNTICPTCHCFLLADQKDGKHLVRSRLWDSCMIKDFARVAGGANPRPRLWMRLRNRFEKKFDFFPKVASVYACTVCGRCITACPAKIDIRKVLKRLVNNE